MGQMAPLLPPTDDHFKLGPVDPDLKRDSFGFDQADGETATPGTNSATKSVCHTEALPATKSKTES